MSQNQERYREIAEAAARLFSTAHHDLQLVQCETGVIKSNRVIVTPHPEWNWIRYEETGEVYRIEMLLTGNFEGIYLRHDVGDQSRIGMGSPVTGYVFRNGLVYDQENASAVAKVVQRLESIWQYSEDQLAKAAQPPS